MWHIVLFNTRSVVLDDDFILYPLSSNVFSLLFLCTVGVADFIKEPSIKREVSHFPNNKSCNFLVVVPL